MKIFFLKRMILWQWLAQVSWAWIIPTGLKFPQSFFGHALFFFSFPSLSKPTNLFEGGEGGGIEYKKPIVRRFCMVHLLFWGFCQLLILKLRITFLQFIQESGKGFCRIFVFRSIFVLYMQVLKNKVYVTFFLFLLYSNIV